MFNRDLLYSDDRCSAFLTEVVRVFGEIHPDRYLGRTAMQKLTYFCQVLGVPIPCRFEIYTYGPYSDTVTFAVDSLIADEVLKDGSDKPHYSNYRLDDNSDILLEKYRDDIAPYQGKIESVVRSLGDFDPSQFELIATLHFIAQRKKRTAGRQPGKDEVVAEFRKIKDDKFTEDEINDFYFSLEGAGLV